MITQFISYVLYLMFDSYSENLKRKTQKWPQISECIISNNKVSNESTNNLQNIF